jgi:hypothetical protein
VTESIEPIYQINGVTCGPTSALMATVAIGRPYPNSYDARTQITIWDHTVTDPDRYPYTTHPRLALFLHDAGYHTVTWHQHEEGYRYTHRSAMRRDEFGDRMRLYRDFMTDAERAGVPNRVFDFTANDIADVITSDNTAVIVMSNIGSGSMFHHRVVTSVTNGSFDVYCPIEGRCQLDTPALDRMMNLPFGRGALLVSPTAGA